MKNEKLLRIRDELGHMLMVFAAFILFIFGLCGWLLYFLSSPFVWFFNDSSWVQMHIDYKDDFVKLIILCVERNQWGKNEKRRYWQRESMGICTGLQSKSRRWNMIFMS